MAIFNKLEELRLQIVQEDTMWIQRSMAGIAKMVIFTKERAAHRRLERRVGAYPICRYDREQLVLSTSKSDAVPATEPGRIVNILAMDSRYRDTSDQCNLASRLEFFT